MKNTLLHLRRWAALIAFVTLILLGLISTLAKIFQDAQDTTGYSTPAAAVKPGRHPRNR